jgi:hypothetical protein
MLEADEGPPWCSQFCGPCHGVSLASHSSPCGPKMLVVSVLLKKLGGDFHQIN